MKLGTYWRGWLSLAVGIGITCVVVFLFKQERDRVEEAQFLFECKEITNRIDLRLHANAQLLRCGAAFLDASDAVDRNDWYKFVQKSRIEQELPGILGTGFSLIIPYKDLNAHTQLIRKMGFPDYTVWPNYKRDVYTSTVMVEPFTQRNIRSFGYDMFTDPVRREAMLKARDLDEPVLSGKVKLVQETETDLQAGCLMYVPVYQKGKSIETVEERQKSIVGWVFSPYRMKDLIWGILNDWDLKKGESALQLSIYDGAVNAENSLLFVSHEEKNTGEGLQFGGQSKIDFNGREWILVFRQERGSLLTVYKGALLAAIGGVIISILMMLLTRSFVETKRRALQMAEQLTVELREQERQLNESQEIARLGRYSLNITEGLWTSSDILDDIFGIDFQKVHQFDEWVNILHPDDREWMMDYFNQFISDKGLFNKEYRILRRSDQQLRWVHGLGKLELDDHQVPVRMVGTMRDITEKKQIEKSLEESHEKYQGLFNNSPLGIYKTTEEGAILDANPALLEMMEYDSLEELQQRGVSVNSYSHNSAVTRDDFIEMISKEGFVKGLEGCWLTKNGKEIHIRESARAVEGTNGLTSCFEGTVEDITEKKLADKEFKDVTNRLQLATSAASIGIWDRNLEGKTSIWDKTMYRLFGCSPDDSLSPDAIWQNAISKEERKRLNFEIQSVLRGEKNYNTEFKIVWPDKSVHYLKGYGFVSYDEDGNPSRLLGINMDITEQKRAEQIIKKQHEELEEKVAERTRELTVSEQKLKESIKEITDYKFALDESSIVAITDNRGVINYANETFCRISKYNLGELIGNTHRVVNSKYHSNDFFIDLWSTISSGKVWRGEIKNRAKDDSIYWVDSTIVPFLDENGKPYQYIAIRFDITTKKIAEEALISAKEQADMANRAKSEFMANMSHEIRTPMNAVIGFSELLVRSIDNDKQRSQVESIRNSGKTLLKIINDILDLSKIEAGKFEIQPSPVNLPSLLSEIENMFIQKAEEKALFFAVEYESMIPHMLMLDEVRVRQILFNLIGNALKFTEKGKIIVTLDARWNYDQTNKIDLCLRVEDTGIGISKDQLEAVFDPFTQQKGQSSKYGGTGLGLSITQKLIVKMGGHIEVTSEPGEGSCFTVLIPNVIVSHEAFDDVEESYDDLDIDFEKANVLLVDDNAENRNLVKALLEYSQLSIYEAEDGKQALSVAREILPDIILMDLRMPVMDGYEAAELLKDDLNTQNIPVIAISASSDKILYGSRSKKIFSEYLLKPLDVSDLFEKLKKYLPYKSSSQEEEDTAQSALLFSETQASKLPELVEMLEAKFIPMHSIAIKHQIIDKIADFGKELKNVAGEYENQYLVGYAADICRFSDNFEIDKLIPLMERFVFMVEQLKKHSLNKG